MMIFRKFLAAAIFPLLLGGHAWAQTAPPQAGVTFEPEVGQSGKDVVWVPTPQALVDRMLDMAGLTPQDYLVDLGSGDGRTVITAAQRGARAHGIEFNPDMVALAKQASEASGVADRATFEQADIFESDFSNATVVTLFLLPSLNIRLRPTILDMAPGTRVVSNSFTMGDWEPDESAQVEEGCSGYCNALKWVVPAKVEGTWKMADKELVLTQTYQILEGALHEGGAASPVTDARMDGAQIQFTVGEQRYVGQVDGDTMQGTVNGATAWTAAR